MRRSSPAVPAVRSALVNNCGNVLASACSARGSLKRSSSSAPGLGGIDRAFVVGGFLIALVFGGGGGRNRGFFLRRLGHGRTLGRRWRAWTAARLGNLRRGQCPHDEYDRQRAEQPAPTPEPARSGFRNHDGGPLDGHAHLTSTRRATVTKRNSNPSPTLARLMPRHGPLDLDAPQPGEVPSRSTLSRRYREVVPRRLGATGSVRGTRVRASVTGSADGTRGTQHRSFRRAENDPVSPRQSLAV